MDENCNLQDLKEALLTTIVLAGWDDFRTIMI